MKMAVTWNHDAHVLAFRRRERAKQAFDEPYWPVGRTIRWIVKREPDEPEAAHVWTELAHRTSAFAAKYDFWRGPENEQQLDAARSLLNAIQAGRIQPIDENGGIMPREKWAHATPGDWPDVRMLRDEILREFPAPANVSAHAATTSAAATSEVPPPPSVTVVEEIAGRPGSEEASGSGDHKVGRPPKWDWDKIEAALEEQCRSKAGAPHRQQADKKWRTKADAYRWVYKHLNRVDGGPSDTAMKENVDPMLDRINARLKSPKLVSGLTSPTDSFSRRFLFSDVASH